MARVVSRGGNERGRLSGLAGETEVVRRDGNSAVVRSLAASEAAGEWGQGGGRSAEN